MKLQNTNIISAERGRKKASVLIVVLWIAVGLVGITLYFANSMTLELRASDNRVSGLEAEQAIDGAARYVAYALANYSTNGSMPTNTQFSCENVPIGDAHFWIIGRNNSTTTATDPAFGLIDESSKINLNTATTNMLLNLPNMNSDLANAIIDWRSSNGMAGYSLNYSSLGYEDKNAPFESVDELRLVYGMTMNLLAGDDVNRNGVLDSNEKSLSGGTSPTFGLFEYTTVYSREPNFHTDGTTNLPINTTTQESLTQLFQTAGVSTSYATQIYNNIHPRNGRANPCASGLDFCNRCLNAGMNLTDLEKIYNNITTTTNLYTYGRVNINTADGDVLAALIMGANVDESTAVSTAENLISYRQQNPNNLTTPGWMIMALGQNNNVVTALASHDWVTTKSFQFTADIAAVGPFGRGYRRARFVFDITDGTPKIIYRQDLSRLGWALGDKTRENLVANNTQ